MRLGPRSGHGLHPQGQIGRGTAQRVAFGQKGGQGRRLGPRDGQHMGQPWMQGQGGQLAAMGGDVPLAVQGTQALQQNLRLGHRTGGRGRQERQVRPAPQRQFQRKGGQVRHLDFSRGKGGKPAFLALGPQPVADALGYPPCPPPALIGLGPGHPLGHQPRHARVRVEPRPPRAASIHHHPDIRQGQRGFRDGCRQHHFAPLYRGQRGPLGGKVHRPEQGSDRDPWQPGQKSLNPPDFTFPRQEDQHPAFRFVQRVPHGTRDNGL